MSHSSFRLQVIDLYNDTTGKFDLDQLERHLTASPNSAKVGFIVSPSFGEVNTVSQLDSLKCHTAQIHTDTD